MNPFTSKISRHWKPLLFFNLFLAAIVVAKIATYEEVWMAKAQLILPKASGNLDANLGTLGSLKSTGIQFSSTVDPLVVQKSILMSKPVLRQVLESDPEKELFGSVSGYQKFFEVSITEKSNTFDLYVNSSDPELSRQRVANWIEAYQERLNQLRQADSQSRQEYQFNQKKVEDARQNLELAEQELTTFKQSSGLVDSEAQTQSLVKTIGDFTSLQKQAEAKAQANQKQISVISERLSLTPAQAIRSLTLSENKDYQFVRNKLVELEANLNKLQTNFTDREPRVQALLQEREELQRRLQRYFNDIAGDVQIDPITSSDSQGRAQLIQQLVSLESEAEANQKQAEELKFKIEQMKKELASIAKDRAQLSKLERQKNITEGVYQGLIAQIQQVNINSFDTYPNVQVIDPPNANSRPSGPDNKLIVLSSLLASLVGSTALLLLLESQDPLLDKKDFQSINFPIVFYIPQFKGSSHALDFPPYVEVEFEKLASAISSQSQFKSSHSASRLLASAEERESPNYQLEQSHRLLITSATTGEGKTTVTIGLAKALVNLGFKVLIVDGDYHKAELSQRFNYHPEKDNIEQLVSIQPNLDLWMTKPLEKGKTVALVSQGQFEKKLKSLEFVGNYDYILIDTSPVSLTSEAVLMTSMPLDVLFVVRQGVSKRDSVTSSLEQLTQSRSNILGLVVNGVKKNAEQYPYRSSYFLASNGKVNEVVKN